MIAGGYTIDRVLESYLELTREDVNAALEYAAAISRLHTFVTEPRP